MTMQASIELHTQGRAGRLQAASFLGLSAAAILMSLLLESPIPFAVGMGVAIVSVALLGIPHGALDLMHLKRLAERLDRREVLWVGLVLYVLLGCLVIAAWIALPAAMLAAFLVATVLHWGSEDIRVHHERPLAHLAELLLRGAIPVTLPSVFHQGETTWLFSQLIPPASAERLTALIHEAWPILVALSIVLIATLAASGTSALRRHWLSLLEISTLAALFALTPPLVAFAVYFGLLHSARFLARYAASTRAAEGSAASLRALVRDAWPMTVLTWVLAAIGYLILSPERTEVQLTMQVVFIGLAALTFPHALLLMGLRFLQARPVHGQA